MTTKAITSLIILMVLAPTLGTADQREPGPTPTRLVLFVASPAAPGEEEQPVVLVSGSVVSLRSDVVEAAFDEEVSELAARLKRVMRLGDIRLVVEELRPMAPDRSESIPVHENPQMELEATLLGRNADMATYRVFAREGGEVLADTRVTTEFGEQAVIGIMNGPASPYLFLVLAPMHAEADPHASAEPSPFSTPPRKIAGKDPSYTQEARDAKIEGIVILKLHIDERGKVSAVDVVKGLPGGLSEAGAEAVRTWDFSPALDEAGRPIAVDYMVTISFRLSDDSRESGE